MKNFIGKLLLAVLWLNTTTSLATDVMKSDFIGVWEEISPNEGYESAMFIFKDSTAYVFVADSKSSGWVRISDEMILEYSHGGGDKLSLSEDSNTLYQDGEDKGEKYRVSFSRVILKKEKHIFDRRVTGLWEEIGADSGYESIIYLDDNGNGYRFNADGKSSSLVSVSDSLMRSYDFDYTLTILFEENNTILSLTSEEKGVYYTTKYRKVVK